MSAATVAPEQKAARLGNAEAIPLAEVPVVAEPVFRDWVIGQLHAGGSLSALFGHPAGERLALFAVISHAEDGRIGVLRTELGDEYPAITPEAFQAHWFERELAEQWGVIPRGHPWLKPIRFHHSYRPGRDAWGRAAADIAVGVTDFFRVEGPEVHEVAVGPVHAGVIEPGHFRFQCHGEEVFHLEISLGYQHRGVEPRLTGGPNKRSIHYAETLAGDTSVGHATAYCQAVEALSGVEVPPRAQVIRGIGLELERLANHTGDLGALCQDVGFLPTSAFCGRLRGDFLNATAQVCGSRFGRGLVRPGGVGFDVEPERAEAMRDRLAPALRDVAGAARLAFDSVTVQARFENCGTVPRQSAVDLGLVGVAARASGVERDIRYDFPSGVWRFAQIPVAVLGSGDVFARAYVRALEAERSGEFVLTHLRSLPTGPVRRPVGSLRPESLAVSLVEGWRGEICHVAVTDAAGVFARYKVVDSSFHNWIGLAMALRNQQISDFPLNNKSFNLSYCGHDL